MSGVSVRKWNESVRVYDAFDEEESVAFGTCDDFEILGGWVSPEEIGIDDVYVALFVGGGGGEGDILSHDVIVELPRSSHTECESPYFAADFALVGFVTVIIGSSGGEFGDEVAVVQFVGRITLKVS